MFTVPNRPADQKMIRHVKVGIDRSLYERLAAFRRKHVHLASSSPANNASISRFPIDFDFSVAFSEPVIRWSGLENVSS